MLPNFFVVGAQKAATTSLHYYLAGHPQIYLPEQKETKFFVDDERYKKGISFYENEHFRGWRGEPAIGEVDPDYMYFEQSVERMACHMDLGSKKFMFIFRDPVERAFSHYLMTYRRGLEPLSFSEAIEQEPERIKLGYDEKLHYSYVGRGYYLQQVERFLPYVNRNQMLFILSEDLKRNPEECLRIIFEFLEVSRDYVPQNIADMFHGATVPRSMALLKRINEESVIKKIVRVLIPFAELRRRLLARIVELNQTDRLSIVLEEEVRERLENIFRPENDRLAEFLGLDHDLWVK